MTTETSNARGELPSRDESRAATEQGLFRKFDVRRTDGSDAPGGKHHGCEYFVLDMTHDPHAKAAAAAYADSAKATHPQLATDMRDRYGLAAPPPAAARGDVRGTRRPSDAAIAAAFWEHRARENSIPSELCDVKLVQFGHEIVSRARVLEPSLAAEGVQAGATLYAAARKLRDSARRMDDGSRWVPGTVFKQFTKALAQEHGNAQG